MSSLFTDSLFGVKGYVAVVTGGSSGLGFMIARVGEFLYAGLRLQFSNAFHCFSLKVDFCNRDL